MRGLNQLLLMAVRLLEREPGETTRGSLMRRRFLTLLLGLLVALLVSPNAASAQEEEGQGLEDACPPPERALEGVANPDRLIVIDPCIVLTGWVVDYPLPQYLAGDGDIHNQFDNDPEYNYLLTDQQETPGNLVVELMPRDGGHLPVLPVGPRLVLVGALVYDVHHAWTELHPVYRWCYESEDTCYRSGPQFGGNPEISLNPREDCITETGQRCQGYEGEVPPHEEVVGSGSDPA
jgi:hypothetical protein